MEENNDLLSPQITFDENRKIILRELQKKDAKLAQLYEDRIFPSEESQVSYRISA